MALNLGKSFVWRPRRPCAVRLANPLQSPLPRDVTCPVRTSVRSPAICACSIRKFNLCGAAICAWMERTKSISRSAATRRANRPFSCTADPVPGPILERDGFSIRKAIASSYSTSAGAAVAVQMPVSWTTPPGIWSRTWKSCGHTCRSIVGWYSAVRGDRHWGWPTRKPIRNT